MDSKLRNKLLRTTGYIAIGVGFYLVYKGTDINEQWDINFDDVIDAEFEIIEEG